MSVVLPEPELPMSRMFGAGWPTECFTTATEISRMASSCPTTDLRSSSNTSRGRSIGVTSAVCSNWRTRYNPRPTRASRGSSSSPRLAFRKMSRPLRLEFPGALWHATSRGVEQRPIYLDDADREHFLQVLERVIDKYRWELHAYVLMSNHYHLLLTTPEPTLSSAMH